MQPSDRRRAEQGCVESRGGAQQSGALCPGAFRVFISDGAFDKIRGWIDSGLTTETGPCPPKEIEVVEAKLLPFET